jgi:hypothetical protein
VAGSSLWLMSDVTVCHLNKARGAFCEPTQPQNQELLPSYILLETPISPRVSANMTAQDKVKETVREEAQRVAELAQDAAQSGAYLYPIRVCHVTEHL